MASISHIILKLLNRHLDGALVVRGRRGYVPAPVYFVRGIAIERTPYKDCVYVRLLRAAFFTALPFVPMDHSPRLSSAREFEHDSSFEGSTEQIAAQIRDAIERERLRSDLNCNPGPEEFLDIIADSDINRSSPSVLFDRACCTALLGQAETAINLLAQAAESRRKIMRRFQPSPIDHAELDLNARLSERLKRGDDIAAELRQICHANAHALGFIPAPLPQAERVVTAGA